MKRLNLLIGCYYPARLDNIIKNKYIKGNVSISNLLYERILFEDFLKLNNDKEDTFIISAPSFGTYPKQCKEKSINFADEDRVKYASYSTNKFFLHYSKTISLFNKIVEVALPYQTVNILISETHLPYLLAVDKFVKKFKSKRVYITLIIPDLPKNINRTKYNIIEFFAKKIYVKKSMDLLIRLPNQYVCFTKEIADSIKNTKNKIVSYGVVPESFKELIEVNDSNKFIYSGKLEERNGIEIMINSFNHLCNLTNKYELIICGDGPMSKFVREESLKNPKIIYKGFLSEEENSKTLKESKLLICPRLPSPNEKYCFPSKLVNYCKYNVQIVVFKNEIYEKVLKNSVVYCEKINDIEFSNALLQAALTPVNTFERMKFLNSCKTTKIIDFCVLSSFKNGC